ncbi:MAG: DUF1553 domain-containing protein [Pirellulaceae bacterium]|nr:DUF1553 domain-containing protein [Pirellulaceae bacterium]
MRRWAVLAMSVVAALAVSSDGGEGHWAYVAPVRPPIPAVSPGEEPRDPVDAFLLARLRKEGLAPAPVADRQTLVRRAALVLTGLPPTPDEARAFASDHAPDAYERLVDRLLASPRYGERMAAPWLDLARYADTHGYHSDSERTMWRWRDWVIEALNAGMPFDQFTIEQLAGDLLPDATREQRIATGFHRNHMLNDENGAIPEEFLTESIVDRVSTTGAVWLGQSLLCARCHDHKYDPFTQRDFYRLYAYFNAVPENGLGGKTGNSPPTILAPTRLQQAELDALAATIRRLDQRLAERAAASTSDQAAWERALGGQSGGLRKMPADAVARFAFDETTGNRAANGIDAARPGFIKPAAQWVGGKFGNALLANGQTQVEIPGLPKWDRSDSFAVSAWVLPTTADRMGIIGSVDEAQSRRGWELGLSRGKPLVRLTHAEGTDEIVVEATEPLAQSKWQHVAATYDGSGQAAGVAIYVGGVPRKLKIIADTLRGHIQGDQPLTIGRGDTQGHFRGLIDEVQLFRRVLSPAEAAVLAGGDPLQEVLAVPAERRTASQAALVRQHYLENHDPIYQAAFAELAATRRREQHLLETAPTTMVMQDLPQPRDTFLLTRGQYDERGERITAGTPASLPALDGDLLGNRLGLARWLVDPCNPLTGRVAASRAWQTIFGAGLVRTPEDFGTRGQRPTHPELLDWLARDLTDRGWDIKRLHRRLVTSAAFRQSSRMTPELIARDPANLLWARGPRHRLPAETLRDQALAAAGLLDGRLGGASVRPYQPAELWKELAYDPSEYSAQVFVPSHGADLYRRSLYTFWKRAAPPPNLALFDAPDRETCTPQRGTSNSPLLALVLLNDTTFVEAARKLAERAMFATQPSIAARIDYLFANVLARQPSAAERLLLGEQFGAELAEFRRHPAAAGKLLGVGESPVAANLDPVELAAWTIVADTILNLDETVTLR